MTKIKTIKSIPYIIACQLRRIFIRKKKMISIMSKKYNINTFIRSKNGTELIIKLTLMKENDVVPMTIMVIKKKLETIKIEIE